MTAGDAALAADIKAAAQLTGRFRLRSGQVSDRYFDKYRFEGDPALLARIAARMLALVPTGTQVLAGLELGGVPIATAMSLQSGLAAVFVRKAAKDYGTCRAVEGGEVSGRAVVIVEDVITTGGAVAASTAMLEAEGARLLGVVCAIWRGQGPPAIAEAPGLPVWPVFTAADLS